MAVPIRLRPPPPQRFPTSIAEMADSWRLQKSAPFGRSRRSGGEDDGKRSLRVVEDHVRLVAAGRGSKGAEHARHVRGRRDFFEGADGPAQVGRWRKLRRGDDHRGRGQAQDGFPFRDRQSGVDARGDRPHLGRSQVRNGILGHGRKQQGHHVALPDAAATQAGGHLAGQAIEVGVAERPPVRGDVGRRVAEVACRLSDQFAEHGPSFCDNPVMVPPRPLPYAP